jgi:DNA-binding transcriptional LysR family regulator
VGIAYTLADHVAPLIAAGRLVPLLEAWTPRPVALYLYYPTRRQIPAALQAFIDFLRKDRRIAGSAAAPSSSSRRTRLTRS